MPTGFLLWRKLENTAYKDVLAMPGDTEYIICMDSIRCVTPKYLLTINTTITVKLLKPLDLCLFLNNNIYIYIYTTTYLTLMDSTSGETDVLNYSIVTIDMDPYLHVCAFVMNTALS
jgi:hypothetical protein